MGTKIPQLPPAVGPFTGLEVFELATSSDVINALSKRITGPDLFKFIGPLSNLAPIPPANFRIPMFRVSDGQVFSQAIDQLGIPFGNVPPGGATGQVLAKLSATSFDDSWVNLVFTGEVTGNGALPTALTIVAGAVTTTKLADDAVTTIKIINNAVDNTKLADMAAGTVKLRPVGAGTGDPVDGTLAQLQTILGLPTASTDNAVPRFNGVLGALENTTVIISDGNDLTVPRGLRVGFTGTPADDAVEVGDAQFNLSFNTGTTPFLGFDTGDLFGYARSGNQFLFQIGNATQVGVSAGLFFPGANDGVALGTGALSFSDLFLASGAVINFANSDYTITHSSHSLTFNTQTTGNTEGLTVQGSDSHFIKLLPSPGSGSFNNLVVANGPAIIFSNNTVNTGSFALGPWTDAAAGRGMRMTGAGVIEFAGTNFRPTTNDGLALGDATLSWSDLFLASGGVINFANSDYTLTHSTGILTGNKDFQITAPGTAAKSVVVRDGTNFPVLTGAVVTAGNTLATTETIDLIVIIGDGTNVITTGAVGNWVEVDFAFTIVQWSILAHESGSISIDVWRTTHSAFDAGATHPVAADKISATSPITFTTTTKGTDSTLTGWTKTISAQDVLAFNVASVTTCKQVVISLKVTKTS